MIIGYIGNGQLGYEGTGTSKPLTKVPVASKSKFGKTIEVGSTKILISVSVEKSKTIVYGGQSAVGGTKSKINPPNHGVPKALAGFATRNRFTLANAIAAIIKILALSLRLCICIFVSKFMN